MLSNTPIKTHLWESTPLIARESAAPSQGATDTVPAVVSTGHHRGGGAEAIPLLGHIMLPLSGLQCLVMGIRLRPTVRTWPPPVTPMERRIAPAAGGAVPRTTLP